MQFWFTDVVAFHAMGDTVKVLYESLKWQQENGTGGLLHLGDRLNLSCSKLA